MTYDEQKQWASDVLGDLSLAIEQKKRIYTGCMKQGALNSAAALLTEIQGMEAELQCQRDLFDMTYNRQEG